MTRRRDVRKASSPKHKSAVAKRARHKLLGGKMKQPEIWRQRYHKMGFLGIPDEVVITLGKGVESDSLSAFDKAEFDASIPDINAMLVTSFIPPRAKLVEPEASKEYLRQHPIVPGSLVPVALRSYSSTRRRQESLGIRANKIFAAIGIVIPTDREVFPTVMMEYAGPQEPDDPSTKSEVEKHCSTMCQRVAELRREYGFQPEGAPRVWIVEEELPEDNKWVCVLAAGLYLRSSLY
jgi:pyruvoyl-dependent arginine decarboxylase